MLRQAQHDNHIELKQRDNAVTLSLPKGDSELYLLFLVFLRKSLQNKHLLLAKLFFG